MQDSIVTASGFDWGVEPFLTLSTGDMVDNPRFVKDSAPKLRTLQRALARKKRGSCNRRIRAIEDARQ